ncbi:MAG: SOS response-associated peptidase family protein [Oscillospiraceae bacterium]|nr:SOS response-associated peptidase family protein [Oscillospiraceae bacterium]
MCCRYYYSMPRGSEKADAIADAMERKWPGKYKTGEIFPGDPAPAMIARREKIVAVPATFGLPGFSDGKLLLNARAETAAEKKTFSRSFQERRILLPATGFYEWGRDPAKTKYLFTVDELPVFYLCGLYEQVDGIYRFVILTRAANASMLETHDRMPVLVGEEAVRPYLTDRAAALEILAGPAPELTRQGA